MTTRTALYRLFDADDVLLYIGIAFNTSRRWMQHKATKIWWPEVARKDVCWYDTRREAEAAEQVAIAEEKPKYNVTGIENPLVVPPKPPKARSTHPVAALMQAGRSYRRTTERLERDREELATCIRDAAANGVRPSEITRLINYAYTNATVSRIIHGKA
jgi:hypothetical protein